MPSKTARLIVPVFICLAATLAFGQYQRTVLTNGNFNFSGYCHPVVSPDGKWAFVANPDHNEVVRVNLLTFENASLTTGDRPAALTLSPDATLLATVNVGLTQFAGDSVSLFRVGDDDTPAERTFTPGSDGNFNPYNNVVFTPDGRHAFVASYYNGLLFAFDPWSGEQLQSGFIGSQASRIAVSPDGRMLAVLYRQNNFLQVKILDLSIFSQNPTYQELYTLDTQSMGQDPSNIAFSPDSRYLLVPAYSQNKVLVYDLNDGSLSHEINTGSGPATLHVDADLNRAYTVNVQTNNVSIINLGDWSEQRFGFTGANLDLTNNVITAPGTDDAFVCSLTGNEIVRFNALTGALKQTYPTGSGPAWIAGDRDGTALVTPCTLSTRFETLIRNRTLQLQAVAVDADTNFGFSLINPEVSYPAGLQLQAYADAGGAPTTTRNLTLPETGQFVREWTSPDLDFPDPFSGWLAASTPLLDIRGFAMVYRRDLSWMDGYTFNAPPLRRTLLPYVDLRSGSSCAINLTNPTDSYQQVRLTWVSGGMASPQQTTNIPANGRVVLTQLQDFFQLNSPAEGYVILDSDYPIQAAVSFGTSDALAILTAESGSSLKGEDLVIPHFAIGGGWATHLVLTNTGNQLAPLQLEFHREDGTQAALVNVNVPANDLVTIDDAPPGLGSGSPGELLTGWIRITGDIPAVRSVVTFRTDDGLVLAALAAQAIPSRDMTFGHIAEGGASNYFTGLALVNTAADPAQAVIRFFAENGDAIGDPVNVTLNPGEKFVRLLSQAPFSLNQQLGGYIKITSDRPLYGYALFGIDQQFLSAIPAQ